MTTAASEGGAGDPSMGATGMHLGGTQTGPLGELPLRHLGPRLWFFISQATPRPGCLAEKAGTAPSGSCEPHQDGESLMHSSGQRSICPD